MTSKIPEIKQTPLTYYPDYCHPLSRTIGTWVPLRIRDICALEEGGWSLEDVRDENTRSRYFLFGNHPLRWVKVTAVVVQIDYHEKGGKKVFILDDGTGVCLECIALNAPKPVFANERSRHLEQLEQVEIDRQQDEEVLEQGKRKRMVLKEDITPSRANPTVPWNDIDVGTAVRVKGKIGFWWGQYQIEAVIIEVVRGLDAEVQAWNAARRFKEDVLDQPWVLTIRQVEKCRRSQLQKRREGKNHGNDDKENQQVRKSTESKGRDGKHVQRREWSMSDEPDRNLKRRKDLERVQKMDGVVKKSKDIAEREDRRAKAEAIALARKKGAGKFGALGI